MADAADLKSVVRKDVRVRLPPSAPASTIYYNNLHVTDDWPVLTQGFRQFSTASFIIRVVRAETYGPECLKITYVVS